MHFLCTLFMQQVCSYFLVTEVVNGAWHVGPLCILYVGVDLNCIPIILLWGREKASECMTAVQCH